MIVIENCSSCPFNEEIPDNKLDGNIVDADDIDVYCNALKKVLYTIGSNTLNGIHHNCPLIDSPITVMIANSFEVF